MEPLQVKVKDAAHLLGYSVQTIYNLINRGELEAVGTGALRRVSMRSIREYIDRHSSTREDQ